MVNLGKDNTFNVVHSSWWTGTETPSGVADKIATRINKKAGDISAKNIVYEVDNDVWYVFLRDNGSNQGWWNGGTKKA